MMAARPMNDAAKDSSRHTIMANGSGEMPWRSGLMSRVGSLLPAIFFLAGGSTR